MVKLSAPRSAIDGANPTPRAASRKRRGSRSKGEPLALCWLFPLGSLPLLELLPRCVLGRAENADIRLVGHAVSRRHAEVVCEAQGLSLRDLGSKNGVFLNGGRVTHTRVHAGDVLRVGNWVGCFTSLRDHSFSGVESRPGQVRQLAPALWGSDAFERALAPARAAAKSTLPLTLVGDSGTGKETLARALHTWSGRPGRLHTLNCASVSERVAQGELFGYPGNTAKQNSGLLRSAKHGTLLLEEVGDLAPALQARLLEVVQSGRLVSDGQSVPVNLRLVLTRVGDRSRASGPLGEALSAAGAGLEVRLPSLHERVLEIPELFRMFVRRHANGEPFLLDAELVEALCLYDWPGNVRELEFLARQLAVLHQGARELGRAHLPRRIVDALNGRGRSGATALENDTTPADPRDSALERAHQMLTR